MKTYKLKIPIGKLFELLNIDNDLYDAFQSSNRKVKINTGTEFVNINAFVKKRGKVRKYILANNQTITCDEKHLVKQLDESYRFIKDVKYVMINKVAIDIIDKSTPSNKDVYDISIGHPHEYITSTGVVCHNTTAAKLIVNSINCDHLYINASDENGMEVIRTKVRGFASTMGFNDLKIIILDECLHEDTLIWTYRKGSIQLIPIKDIDDNNDLVKSFNFKTNTIEWRPFTKLDKGNMELYEIEFENNEKVICTASHKWYVYDASNQIIRVPTTDLHLYSEIISP